MQKNLNGMSVLKLLVKNREVIENSLGEEKNLHANSEKTGKSSRNVFETK